MRSRIGSAAVRAATLLFVLAGLWALWEGYRKLDAERRLETCRH